MDIRHPLKELDLQLIEWFIPANKPIHVLLSKADKLSKQGQIMTLRKVREALASMPMESSVQLFSSLTRAGLEEAAEVIQGLLKK
jgi:GTP-binding protein